ncbi:hypothetical protein GCM10020366_13110 [Saccharopolyspora gregorii]|uniref:Uncharacterized protein n=1 Tax=Saccharopolyspora gregorii TaxID=33914 RepID=A0ABP6RMX1_9PSEU
MILVHRFTHPDMVSAQLTSLAGVSVPRRWWRSGGRSAAKVPGAEQRGELGEGRARSPRSPSTRRRRGGSERTVRPI